VTPEGVREFKDRHGDFRTGREARAACMLALRRAYGIHLTKKLPGQGNHFCHKLWITSRHTGSSLEADLDAAPTTQAQENKREHVGRNGDVRVNPELYHHGNCDERSPARHDAHERR
jgi:hypothetical protein